MQLFILTAFCLTLFASNSILCRAALVTWGMEPLQYTAIRIISGALMLALLCMFRVIKTQGISVWKDTWAHSSWPGAIFLFLYMICFSTAYVDMPSAAGTLIINISVQFGMVGWGILQGIRPGRTQTAGLCIAFAGLAALVSPGLTAPPLISSLLMTTVGLVWSGYTLCRRKNASPALATAGNFFRCAIAGTVCALLALLFESPAQLPAYVCAVISGALASSLGYLLWYTIVPSYSLVSASIIQLCVPLITAVLAVLILDEAITLRLVLCAIPILGGIGLALLSQPGQASRTTSR